MKVWVNLLQLHIFQEIYFIGNSIKTITKFPSGEEYESNYEVQIVYKNDEGGAYNTIFLNQKKDLYAYIFDEDMLILVKEGTEDKYVYLKK